MTSCSWLWVYAGLALALLEIVTPGFILCFFGLAAATVGVLRFVFGESFDLTWQLAAFSVFSVLYIVLLRRVMKKIFVGDKDGKSRGLTSDYVGRAGTVVAAITPPKTGRVLLGDAEWNACANVPIAVGADIKVISQSNLTMKVEVI